MRVIQGHERLLEEMIALITGKNPPDLPEKGTPISLSGAARKYVMTVSTLWFWTKRGWIPTLQMPVAGGAVRLIDEHYVALAVYLYKQSGPGKGKHIMEVLGPKLRIGEPDTN